MIFPAIIGYGSLGFFVHRKMFFFLLIIIEVLVIENIEVASSGRFEEASNLDKRDRPASQV